MRSAARVLTVVLTLSISGLTTQAEAKRSTGLYAPFPSLNRSGYLQAYVADFGVVVPKETLRRGTEIGIGLSAATSAAEQSPSARISGATGSASGILVGGLFASIGGAALFALFHRTGRSRPHTSSQ